MATRHFSRSVESSPTSSCGALPACGTPRSASIQASCPLPCARPLFFGGSNSKMAPHLAGLDNCTMRHRTSSQISRVSGMTRWEGGADGWKQETSRQHRPSTPLAPHPLSSFAGAFFAPIACWTASRCPGPPPPSRVRRGSRGEPARSASPPAPRCYDRPG